MTQDVVCQLVQLQAEHDVTSIGCVARGAATQGLSANFGQASNRFWANTCAFSPKVPTLMEISGSALHASRGWANRGAAWSISRLTNGPHRHTGEAVCSLPPSSSSVWSGMRCSKQHSSRRRRATWVHLSRTPHPHKHDVPHTPPREGRRNFASALFGAAVRGVAPC